MRRREKRTRGKSYKFLYITGAVAIFLAIMIITLYSIYNKQLNDISKSMLSTEQIIGLVPNEEVNTANPVQVTGSTISKTIEEVQKEIENQVEENEVKNEEVIDNTIKTNAEEQNIPTVKAVKKELSFAYPVEGEILREYAMDELIFSETLDEWTVHQGLDIKADRTTVVKTAQDMV